MIEPFAAKLRIPKRELWLGCKIRSWDIRVSSSGIGAMLIRFDNCPIVATYNDIDAYVYRRTKPELFRDVEGMTLPFDKHDELAVEVKWGLVPNHGICPSGRLIL